VTAFNGEQDGHRTNVNAMSYSAVDGWPLETCVKDNVTGLIWEGKEATGPRAGSNIYTNLDNGLADDASGYVASMNTANLCGFDDWRLPTVQELRSIQNLGRLTGPLVNTTWFPNTFDGFYWSVEALRNSNTKAWILSFSYARSLNTTRSNDYAVRLVRGSPSSGSRYTYATVAYGSDGANNVVNDAWTGLQWRRCEQGRTWNGSACTGTATTYTHEQAMGHARTQTGWRLPNFKELESLVDRVDSGAAHVQSTAFPGANGLWQWSSSPFMGGPSWALGVNFNNGDGAANTRLGTGEVRLVRASQ
jgi:hypothetical protein